MYGIDLTLLSKLNKPAPRYTSYPTAPEWENFSPEIYERKLKELSQSDASLSLYFHIPFCKTMCLYCGCSVVLNRKAENEERYVDYLIKEISLICTYLGKKRRVVQLHFGGGTPTKLSKDLFARLFDKINASFEIDYTQEISIEIDPRTVLEDEGEKLCFLKQIGFNRVSFGVQDTDPKVQKAIKRKQSLEITIKTYTLARSLGFKGINIDLIYGLPFQTVYSFDCTVTHILQMRPDRIAFFSYAKVPWLKPHQKAIPENTLPTIEEKFLIYANARHRFVNNGYIAIGMDHFALQNDELAEGYLHKRLQRNFQGYSLKLAEDTLSFGISSISYINKAYIQNVKELNNYYSALDKNDLPIQRGKMLSEEDFLRKWVIHTLMCDFELDKDQFKILFGIPFDCYFKNVTELINQHAADGLLFNTSNKILITPRGELFIRMIATTFDAYYKHDCLQKFSQVV